MGSIQQTACSPCDIDDARDTLARSVTEKKELALPNYRREIAGGEIGNEWTDRAAHHSLLLNPEPFPLRRPVTALKGQTCCCQTINDLDEIGITNIEGQMARNRSRRIDRIAAVAVSEQGKGSG